jgi:hypothetical protein
MVLVSVAENYGDFRGNDNHPACHKHEEDKRREYEYDNGKKKTRKGEKTKHTHWQRVIPIPSSLL